ncbi:hypothetical protein AVEN_223638-1 [Araneus ventricosus]|uniref:Uncharacterized protein n=1 Tax=Araneus ventricosus TaxID=182803 RepID=A0A4Y2UYI5_ARAVE|nr:hypothetical protein AVEN_223638-1 [Araneus ventricosus]
MPEGAGVIVSNEPDGNSDLDEQMEMSPSLAANPTPIQVSKEIPDLTPFFRRAVATRKSQLHLQPMSARSDALKQVAKTTDTKK